MRYLVSVRSRGAAAVTRSALVCRRYDGRGALADLRPHEPPPGGYDRWQGLTERERKMEEVVDQERYLALYRDVDEEKMLEGDHSRAGPENSPQWYRGGCGVGCSVTYVGFYSDVCCLRTSNASRKRK